MVTARGELAIFKAGKLLGRESFDILPEGGGFRAHGRVTLDLPGGFEQESDLALDAAYRPRRYMLDRRSGGESARLEVTFADGRALLTSVTERGDRREEIEVQPDFVVLGSNLFHHFALLWPRYDRVLGGRQSFPAFPHRSVRVEQKSDRRARIAGREELLAHLFVDVDGVQGIDLFFREGQLLKVAVPLQRLEAVLEGVPGFTRETEILPATAEPAPDPALAGHEDEEVRFPSIDGVILAGSFTRPASAPPWPGVVLLSGSGPQDRNGDTVGFGGVHFGFLRTLAHRLAHAGLAVLRYDERGVAASSGNFKSAGLSDLTTDARAALGYLAARPEVRSRPLGIVGHSEGGLIAALVAADPSPPSPSAIALLATLARPLDHILLDQFERLLAPGISPEQRTAAVERRRETLKALKETGDWESPEVEEEVRRAIAPERRRWFAEHFALDPRAVVRKVPSAVAIFQGERDAQLDPAEGRLLAEALAESGHPDATLLTFPFLDHFFMPSTGRGLSEYADESRRVDEGFLAALVEWMAGRLGAG